MRAYDGFVCEVELSFDHQGSMFVFDLRTDWYQELTEVLEEIETVVGLDAMPIVGLLSFLIGVVMAYQGADQLRRFGAEARPALAALLTALDDENLLVRSNIVPALGTIDAQDPTVLAALARAVKDKCAAVRLIAVKTLGEIAPRTKESIAALQGALADPDPDVCQFAAEALRKIGHVEE